MPTSIPKSSKILPISPNAIREACQYVKIREKAWIARASFGFEDDKEKILKMLKYGQIKRFVSYVIVTNINRENGEEERKSKLRCYCALKVVKLYNDPRYFDTLKSLLDDTNKRQEASDGENISSTLVVSQYFIFLLGHRHRWK